MKCAAVWFAMCLSLRPARATFVTSNDLGGAARVHSREYLLSLQHVDTPAPSIDIDWSDVTQNSKPKMKKKLGSKGGGSKQTEKERLQATRCYPVRRVLLSKQDSRTFSFDKI